MQVIDGVKDLAHVPQLGRLFAALLADRRVPLWLKLCAAAGAVYVVSPIDVIPDTITGIGYLDDIIMVVLIVQTFITMAPEDVVLEHCARLGIDPGDVHINIARAVTTSIGAVLPFLEGGKSEQPERANSRYSTSLENDNAADEQSQPGQAASAQADVEREHPGMRRYSAYSTPQQD